MYLVKSAALAQGWDVTVTRHTLMRTHVVEDISNWLYIYLPHHCSLQNIAEGKKKRVWIITCSFRDFWYLLMNTLWSFIFQMCSQMCNLLISFSMHFYIPEDPLVTEHFQSLLLFGGINYLLIDSPSKFKIAFKNSSLFWILITCTLNSKFFHWIFVYETLWFRHKAHWHIHGLTIYWIYIYIIYIYTRICIYVCVCVIPLGNYTY